MYIYRPHRPTLAEAMEHAAIYEDYDLMVAAIVEDSAYLTGEPLFFGGGCFPWPCHRPR